MYRKFYIQYAPYVAFTKNGKAYTRRLYLKDGKNYIKIDGVFIEIPDKKIY